jgi:hypothetical protein
MSPPPPRASSFGPWLWAPSVDLAVFAGSAAFALALVALRRMLGLSSELPDWAWLAFVLGIDVAHVYSTLFRTYFDGDELRRHPVRYAAVPVMVYATGVLLYVHGSLTFWTALAYVALYHFIRQQVGWVALYRAQEKYRLPGEAWVDTTAIHAAMLYPVFVWHADLGAKPFSWFVEGDFRALPAAFAVAMPVATGLWSLALGAFAVREAIRYVRTRRLALGRVAVVSSTALVWYVGIADSDSDFDFTVTNVIAHGVPYVALLFSYTRTHRRVRASSLGSAVASGGLAAFLGLLFVFAFVEEMMWDRYVFGDRPWLFGRSDGSIGGALATALVPLLAVPQASHYVLDGMLWRRRDTRENPVQRLLLGRDA